MVLYTEVPEDSEILYEGITFKRILDGKVNVFYGNTQTDEAIDAWYRKMVALVEESQANNAPLYLLYVYQRHITLTNYGRLKVADLIDRYPNCASYSALVVPNHVTANLLRVLSFAFRNSYRRVQFFSSVEKAIEWQKQNLKQHKA
jgi:hypothetical protein